jgi:uncharacterized protein YycO
MKFPFLFHIAATWIIALAPIARGDAGVPALREGDVVFSSSAEGQGQAVMAATRSIYTHCGVVFLKDGKLMVLEAVEPVGVIPLATFISRSAPGTFMARRLKEPVAPAKLAKARAWGEAQIGKKYDLKFRWDDDRMYCSELVWKIYEKAGVRLCQPSRFQDYDLSKPSVKKIIEERYGDIDAMPKDEKVVAPSDLANSNLLFTVTL